VLARLTRNLRESSSVDQRSGVSARFAIAAAEGVAASALRRAARTADHETAVARICDLAVVLPTLLGKIEFEMGEEGRERAIMEHLLRLATAATFRDRLSGLDLSGFTQIFAEGAIVETGDLVPASDLLAQLGAVPGLFKVLNRLGYDDAACRGEVAAAAEFALEGLHLTRRIEKEFVNGRAIYGAA
jgi:magnesium chelatase subunit I